MTHNNPNDRKRPALAPSPSLPAEDLLEAGARLLSLLGENGTYPPLTVTVEGSMVEVRIRRRKGQERAGR